MFDRVAVDDGCGADPSVACECRRDGARGDSVVVAVRTAWITADVVVSPHHPSLRLAPIQRYKSGPVVGGVAWLSILAATAILLPQLLTTVASAPHLAGTIRVGVGALIVISLLAAVLIASRQGRGSGKRRRERPRFPKAFIAAFVIVATAILAFVGGGRVAALLVDVAIVAALLGISKRIVFFSGAMPPGKTRSRSQRRSLTCCRLSCCPPSGLRRS